MKGCVRQRQPTCPVWSGPCKLRSTSYALRTRLAETNRRSSSRKQILMSSATRYSWLLCSRLRASRDWELVLIDRLPAAERHSFGQGFSSDVYGILRPLSNDRPIKAVGPDTALLFITLQEAMPLPAYVKAGFGDESDSAIAQLVGDGIFEVEIQGEWMSGPRALDAAINPGVDIPVPTAETARAKSRLALMMAAALPSPEPDTLFSFLYRY